MELHQILGNGVLPLFFVSTYIGSKLSDDIVTNNAINSEGALPFQFFFFTVIFYGNHFILDIMILSSFYSTREETCICYSVMPQSNA